MNAQPKSAGARRPLPVAQLATLILALAAWGCEKRRGAQDHDEHGHSHEKESGEHGKGAQSKDEHEHEHADEVTLSADAIARYGVVVGTVEKRVLIPTFLAPAQVGFNQEGMAHVGSPVHGRITELRARLGDDVKKGDVLLVIESPELGEAQSDYLQKRSASSAASPAVDLAKSAHERARSLYETSQGIALTEVQKREAEFRVAQAGLLAARTAELAAENRLHLFAMDQEMVKLLAESGEIDPVFQVRAPIDGQVIEREVTLGELVGPEREALLILADMSKLWVLADVPESRVRETKVGAKARVHLGLGEDHWCEGTVAFISPALDPATRSVRVRIDVADRHPELRPGVFAQAEIESTAGGAHGSHGHSGAHGEGDPEHAAEAAVLAIPAAATQTVDGAPAVFVAVAGEPGTFAKRAVSVGRGVGGWLPVHSGLAEGERLVVSGSFILKAELGKASAEHQH